MTSADAEGPPPRPLSFHFAYAIWLFGILSYFLPGATWSPVSRYSTTRAIVERGELTIDAYATSTGDRALRGGHWYSDKAPIPAFVAVAPYTAYRIFDGLRGGAPRYTAIGTADLPAKHVYPNDSFRKGLYICSLTTAAASGAALGAILFLLLRKRTSDRTALVASAFTVLGTPILPYATSFYGHVPAGAFLFGALLAADGLDVAGGADLVVGKRLRVVGACLAAAVGCEYLVSFPAVIVGAFVLFTGRRRLAFVVRELAQGALAPVLLVSAYHAACFGAPWKTGYSFIQRPEFAAGHATGLLGIHLPTASGLYGLLMGERRGLFFISPVALALACMILPAAKSMRDTTARLAIVTLGALLWLNSGYYMWWGGAASGARHLVPAMGAIAFGIAAGWDVPRFRIPIAFAAFASFVNCLVLTAVGLEAPEQGNVLTDYAFRRLLHGDVGHISGASNLGIEIGLAPAASLGPLLAWILIGFRFLVRLVEKDKDGENPLDLRAIGYVALALFLPGCVGEKAHADPANVVSSTATTPSEKAPSGPTLASYPGGEALVGDPETCQVHMLGRTEQQRWDYVARNCGGILGVVVAKNSVAYARSSRDLIALSREGAALWTKPLSAVARELARPAVTLDSLVVTLTSPQSAVAFRADGAEAWTFRVDGVERLMSPPERSESEGVLLTTNAAVYLVGSDGLLRYRSAFVAPP